MAENQPVLEAFRNYLQNNYEGQTRTTGDVEYNARLNCLTCQWMMSLKN